MGNGGSTPVFHVFAVSPGSAAEAAGLEPLFDVITEVDGSPVDECAPAPTTFPFTGSNTGTPSTRR